MKMLKLKEVLRERWRFYLIGYLIGYMAPMITQGIKDWKAFFPIKLMGIGGALCIGTAFYYGSKKVLIFAGAYRSIKYVVAVIILFIISFIVREAILELTGFDILPYIWVPEP